MGLEDQMMVAVAIEGVKDFDRWEGVVGTWDLLGL